VTRERGREAVLEGGGEGEQGHRRDSELRGGMGGACHGHGVRRGNGEGPSPSPFIRQGAERRYGTVTVVLSPFDVSENTPLAAVVYPPA
jgi:hypothetical protein